MYWIIGIKLTGILRDAGAAEPEGLVRAMSGGMGMASPEQKKINFSLAMACFGEL